jgi:hypothetical protein
MACKRYATGGHNSGNKIAADHQISTISLGNLISYLQARWLLLLLLTFRSQVQGYFSPHIIKHLDRHAVKCVPKISEKYLENGRTLVLSLPASNTLQKDENTEMAVNSFQFNTESQLDTNDILLEHLHSSLSWPILVFSPAGEIRKLDPRDWNSRNSENHGSYILIARYHGGDLGALREQIYQLESLSAWNSRAKFVVVAEENKARQNDEMLKDILKEFWKWNIFNLVVLSPTELTSSSIPVGVYTWFPYRLPSGRCGELLQFVRLDTCLTTNNTTFRFINDSPIFEQKIPYNLNGCPFRVSTLKFHPFIIYDNSTLDGSEIRLIVNLAAKINVSLKLSVSMAPERKGQQLSNGTWTGLRGEIMYGFSDMIFGHILTNLDDHLVFDDTIIYSSDKFSWYIARANPYPRWLSMARVFTPEMWLLLLIVIPVAAFAMKCLSQARGDESWSYVKSVLSFWAALLGSGADMPYSPRLRVFFLSWVIYSLAVNTVFQTYVTSYLVDPGLQHQIDNNEELYESNAVFAFPDTIDKFLTKELSDKLKPRIQSDPVVSLEYVANKDNFATVAGKKLVAFFSENLAQSGAKHEIFQFREDMFQLSTVMLLPKGSPFLDLINDMLTRLLEAGLIDKWYKDIITENQIKAGVRKIPVFIDDYIPLSLSHLQASFIFLFLGIGISTVVLLVEKFVRRDWCTGKPRFKSSVTHNLEMNTSL